MAIQNLYSINSYLNLKTLEGIRAYPKNLSIRIPRTNASGFNRILSAIQTHISKKNYKTRGLTIQDYRAQPVISKSRIRLPTVSATKKLKNSVTNRFPYHQPLAVNQKESMFHINPKMNAAKSIEMQRDKAEQQFPKLTEQQIIAVNVQKAAAKYNLPPELINAVIRVESNFKTSAVSPAGAQGLMQLMPATAKALGVKNPFDIQQNIDGGAKYLRKMLDHFEGNVRNALAAYNAGPGTVMKYNGRVPYPETRQYVKRVIRFSKQTA